MTTLDTENQVAKIEPHLWLNPAILRTTRFLFLVILLCKTFAIKQGPSVMTIELSYATMQNLSSLKLYDIMDRVRLN